LIPTASGLQDQPGRQLTKQAGRLGADGDQLAAGLGLFVVLENNQNCFDRLHAQFRFYDFGSPIGAWRSAGSPVRSIVGEYDRGHVVDEADLHGRDLPAGALEGGDAGLQLPRGGDVAGQAGRAA